MLPQPVAKKIYITWGIKTAPFSQVLVALHLSFSIIKLITDSVFKTLISSTKIQKSNTKLVNKNVHV